MQSLFVRTFQAPLPNPERPPLWLMRQAGRYLPEYRAVRAGFPDFMAFCYTPEAATTVTLQPITRFDLDAAIIFADILTIPDALGHRVTFTTGEGPHVEKLTHPAQVNAMVERLPSLMTHLNPITETVRHTRAALPESKAVIGFSGAPWTLASYLFENKPSHGTSNLLTFQAEYPDAFTRLITVLTEACITYLQAQITAGASAVQVFDSWAGACPAHLWQQAVHQPLLAIRQALHTSQPATPVLLFPRLATGAQLKALANALPERSGLSLSTDASLTWAAETLACTVQGNLDPTLMTLDSPAPLAAAAQAALATMRGRRYIMNLGHGLTPATNPDRVAQLADLVRRAVS